MRTIEEEAIRAAVGAPEALDAVESAFAALGRGAASLPAPMGLEIPEVEGEVHIKSAHIAGAPVFAVKIASGFYRNVDRDLPTGSGLMMVFAADTGFPVALLLDNGYLTDLRTAAAGALAARYLAHERLDTVAVLGSGVQARYQACALQGVRSWRRTVAWSPTAANLRRYCTEMETELGIPFTAAAEPEDAVGAADLVITVTPSRRPLFDAAALRENATVIAVGSDGPDKRELATSVLARADKIVVDRLSQCAALGELHHAVTEGKLSEGDVHAELGEIVIGQAKGRESDELIICDLTGVGVQDAAVAEVAWRRAG
ncbi:MAG: ornithine cyclodeaminase family protein [Gemmatimonadetes bacterium]|uniref:Ornithine cyclodeaminase family protein n=1 Tax=Candidatus Kutchimonas denitrificans TaxID=3056748 RepID=A0AAE5CAN1_9BACT|nr:ornithine cyclodeaminase family protein [Gemmatimonadota bacterium]NIR73533.1 ornithine cyclodeaminase family protein [Candidatus Kutchimonas denitrificans]NIR99492.1 ornithine cyclodeaminase family protein [Gemmatimonadota bacterium]NIT65112.1 ornithine cyclodeaminase family protein [Gemmatimonadota bacterium]NIV23645.1 ornithine cyclodeaminase family protein [Gemmatimonadota bacterium]